MNNLIEQISIGCTVNSAIMNNTMKNNDFLKSCIEVPKKYNIIAPQENMPWPFFNTSWEAYKLYCMIVVPKELYNLSKDDEFYQNLLDKNIMRNFNIIKSKKTFEKSPVYHFNSLRNSISHVNYSFDENKNFIMWDHKPGQSEEVNWHWYIKISQKNMNIFLGELNEYIFQIYNEIKSGVRNPMTYEKNS